jgi:hypothetical protein
MNNNSILFDEFQRTCNYKSAFNKCGVLCKNYYIGLLGTFSCNEKNCPIWNKIPKYTVKQ